MARIRLNESAILADRGVQEALEQTAASIVVAANRNTDAPIGVTYNRVDDQTIRIGPRGAAAIAVEYGSRFQPARRPVKRALDQHRIR